MTDTKQQNLRDRIKANAPSVKCESYTVKEWDEELELRGLTIGQKMDLGISEDGVQSREAMLSFLPRLVVLTCHDPKSGERVFADEDSEWVSEQPAATIEPIAEAALRLSGISEEEGAAPAQEEAKKGS